MHDASFGILGFSEENVMGRSRLKGILRKTISFFMPGSSEYQVTDTR